MSKGLFIGRACLSSPFLEDYHFVLYKITRATGQLISLPFFTCSDKFGNSCDNVIAWCCIPGTAATEVNGLGGIGVMGIGSPRHGLMVPMMVLSLPSTPQQMYWR